MIRLIRVVGFLLIAAGVVVVVTWLIEPLRAVWPWLRQLPWQLRFGFGVAVAGLAVLLASMIWERLEARERDRSLRKEE